MSNRRAPAVLQNPEAGIGLKRGFDTLAQLLALTLGPAQGIVLATPPTGSKPEILNDAATIARRVMELPNRTEDVGAMLLRNLVWRMHTRVGDGSATAAVLAQAILDQAHRYEAAGANPMSLRSGIDRAATAALETLQALARPVASEEDLVAVSQAVTGEPDLSLLMGELFDILGPEAHISIEEYVAPYLEREYIEGGRWVGRLASPYLISVPSTRRAILTGCHVVLFEGDLVDLDDVQPLLEVAAGTESSRQVRIALFAHQIKGAALSTLVANHQRGAFQIIAAELRRPAPQRRADFEDLAALSGARSLSPETGSSLRAIKIGDLGSARRVEANAEEVILVAEGQQSSAGQAVRAQIEKLQGRLENAKDDLEEAAELRFRLARLSGQTAVLKIGASTDAEREHLLQKARKGLRALPIALREGIVPGGGVAYLNCIPAVRRVRVQVEGEAAWGADIVARALEEPFRRLASNAGVSSPTALLAEAQRRGAGFGYDAVRGQLVDMEEAGILDAAGVLGEALKTAVSGAVMALTTAAIVHKRLPAESLEP